MNFLDAALALADKNFHVFPCRPGTKVPATAHGVKDATTDREQIRQWWTAMPNANVAVATNRLCVLDVDLKNNHDGEASLNNLCNGHGHLPPTLKQRTPSGGRHFVFRTPESLPVRNSASKLGDGLDVRGEGGYIVVAPSIIDGKPYTWTSECEPAPAPEWLLEKINGASGGATGERSKLDLAAALTGKVSLGARNDQAFRTACKWRADDIPLDQARRMMLEYQARCPQPLDPREFFSQEEALACLANAWRYEPRLHLTDLGNAQRFVVRHGANVRYIPEFRRWIIWNGERWQFDEDGEVARLAKETALSLYVEAAEEPDNNRRTAIGKWAATSESERRLKAIVELAKTEPGIPLRASMLDADPWLLGVINGVFDLKNGALRLPRRAEYITKRAHVEYRPDAKCPTWLSFLTRIFNGNNALIEFIQRATGYSLTGLTIEQCLFLLWGGGANGKSTFLNAVRALLADYSAQTDMALLMVRDRSGASPDVARLRGARLVCAIETEDGQRLAESLIKQLTGQDTVTARFLYADFFEFIPNFKLWLAANHKPVVVGDDNAIWRRIHLVPFEVQIPEAERDKTLPDKLRAELPGILNWALEGCRAWQEQGLAPPDEVKTATAEYRREMDILQDFLDACCVIGPNFRVSASALYAEYSTWADESGHHAWSQTRFGRKLAERGFQKRATPTTEYLGLGLGLGTRPM